MDRKFSFVEMFVGAGGSHLGFRKQGDFKTLLASDIDKDMCRTFEYNNSEVDNVLCRDIYALSAKEILERTGLEKGELDVMFGGVVCKGFSLAGVRSSSDPRNNLYREYIRLVAGTRPKVAIIENVPGMASMTITDGEDLSDKQRSAVQDAWKKLHKLNGLKSAARKGVASREQMGEIKAIERNRPVYMKMIKKGSVRVIDDIIRRYRRAGYNVLSPRILNAADYGDATERRRLIIVAIRKDLDPSPFKWPEKISGSRRTVRDALASIDYSADDPDNVPMSHSPKTVERFSYIPEGRNVVSVMDKLPDSLKISEFYSRGATMRLAWDRPAPTLVPGHSNFPVHPKENRSITVREAAAIMGFPNSYRFFGSHTKRCEMAGQAVAVGMASAIAESVSRFLRAAAYQIP